jgi:hypothetical protein
MVEDFIEVVGATLGRTPKITPFLREDQTAVRWD